MTLLDKWDIGPMNQSKFFIKRSTNVLQRFDECSTPLCMFIDHSGCAVPSPYIRGDLREQRTDMAAEMEHILECSHH